MTKVMEDIERIQVFASGDEAYLVGQRTAGLLTTWIASNRSTALDITDIFGRSIIVEPGTHGVRIFDRNETGIPLVQRMAFALQTKNYEADLIARLFETTTRSDESRELWQRFLLEMANEDIRSHRDAVLFVRRFAIAYKEEIDSIRALARNNWFTKEQAPIQIELSSDEADDVMSRTSDQISVHLDALQGAQNKQLVRDMAGDLSTRIKEHLSTGTLEWWNARETEGIPHELGILWGILDRGHNGALLKKMLLLLLSFQIETDVRDGMDTLPADLTPLLRTALRFIMENIIEIRFGDILYLDGKLRYDLKKHRSYAEITRVRLDHPELRTVLFSSKFDPRKRIGMLVSEGDYDRIIQHSRTIGRGRISFEYFNIDSGQMEPTSFEMDGAVARPSPLDEYAHIIYEIFSEPRLLALGYMISSISNLLSVENSIYNAMVRLFDKHRFPVGEPQSSKIRKLIDLERDMEILFRKRLMEQEERPAAPESTPQQRGPGITIEGFLDDETELTVEGRRSGTIVLDIHDQTSLFHDGHAHRVIESSLENNLGGFKDLPSQTRRNMVRAIANMAQLRPGEPITVTQQALTNYYASMGMTMPAMIRPFTIPNFFMMNLMPKIR